MVQLTSQKTSQRPNDKLKWQKDKMVNIPTAILAGVTTFPLPSMIVVDLAHRSSLMIKNLHSEQTRVTSRSCTTKKTNMGMLRIRIKG
jgi:hypothetical protein